MKSCAYCGKEFIKRTRSRDSNKYCSRECYFESIKKKPQVKPKVICSICGKEFEGRKDKKYCSDECRKEIARFKSKEYWNKNKAASIVNEMITKTCKECGIAFSTNYRAGIREYCSDNCARKHFKKEYKEQRKKQINKAFIQPVYYSKIYQRDKGICQICGHPVDYEKNPEDPMGTTIDHIVPLSKGGRHHPDNCQLAHRRCNSIKGINSIYKIEA